MFVASRVQDQKPKNEKLLYGSQLSSLLLSISVSIGLSLPFFSCQLASVKSPPFSYMPHPFPPILLFSYSSLCPTTLGKIRAESHQRDRQEKTDRWRKDKEWKPERDRQEKKDWVGGKLGRSNESHRHIKGKERLAKT